MMLLRVLRSGRAVVSLFIMLFVAMFLFEGDRSLSAAEQLDRQIAEAQVKLDRVRADREAVERKVVALRPGTIDGDLLDEQARVSLGYAKQGEIVILGR